ncbi:hypothetical protein AB0M20_12540 [Actinoplanes sp. NPDC051633]|uniref:hypothetical protein n=1 Tax=Actinoplanes sp. NPDC051633 TaxID=3155670 RepID=UPI00343BA243
MVEPADVVDRLLWQDAQQMLDRHTAPDPAGTCVWCGWHWPCAPRRLAERAAVASRRPWREAWTLRHDLNSIRAMPGLDDQRRRRVNQRRRIARTGNRGSF